MNLLLKNGRLVDPLTGRDETVDLLIQKGLIEKIGARLNGSKGVEERNLGGALILPGFIDMHVHLREPGYEYKETIESGTLAAAAGGFTGVCCMPNTNPAIDDASVVRLIKERAAGSNGGIVDVHPVAAVTIGRQGKQLTPMMELAESGAVGFSDDGDPVRDSEVMRRALEYAAMAGKPVIQHAEESTLTRGGAMNEGAVSTSLGMPAMPAVAEDIMVSRDLQLLSYTGGQYHLAHVSTGAAVAKIAAGKKRGLSVTCEVSPHHFTLTDEVVRSFSTNTKMNPPLRSREDVESMIEGLRDGTIDAIASDHAPHSYDDKEVEFLQAPFGIVGLETAVGLAFTMLLVPKILNLVSLIEKFSTNPRRILHLPEVRLAEGEAANLTLIDPEARWTVSVREFKSKSKNSPFDGWKLQGRAIGVINNDHAFWLAP